MKIAVLNDTHCGIRNSSEVFLNNAAKFYDEVFEFFFNYDDKQKEMLFNFKLFILFKSIKIFQKSLFLKF